jgi:alkylation response protein AidB-like acyl-CoA dehydrogenase
MKPADIAALRRQVRELTGRWRAESRYVPRNDSWLRGFDLAFSRELAALGLIGLTWPVEHGGRGLPNVARAAVTEELLRAGAPVAAHWIGDRQIGPSVLRRGSERLRAEILPGIISADYVFCLGMSEPEAGSDLASVRTVAAPDGDGWRVRGRKIWTSGAHRATHAYLLARTERAADRHDGLTEFIVDMDSPGITVSPIVDLTGEHHFNEVLFDDVPVPGHRVLGQAGDGWRQVVEQLSFERGGPERFLSSYTLLGELLAAVGGGRAELLGEFGELAARLATLRRIAWQVAVHLDAGEAPVVEAATLKYLGNAFETDVIEVSRRAFGAGPGRPGFREALLASPGFSLRGGAAEVMLSVMARQEVAARGGPGGSGTSGGDLDDLIADIAARHAEPAPGELPGCWQVLVELGLPLVGVAEDQGGSGGSLADLAVLVRALGRHAISTPLIENAVSNWVLAAARGAAAPGLRTISLDASGGVAWARHADQLVVYRGDVARVADARAPGVAIEPGDNLAGEPWDAVRLDEGTLAVLDSAPPAAQVRARLGLLRAAALSGAVAGAYELTRDHVSTREQFGRPLVRIPAVAANLARVKAALIQCDAALDRACLGRAADGSGVAPDAAADWLGAVAAARIIAGRAATETARLAHQLHGAIGVTAEYPLHRFTKRLWAWRDADTAEHEWSVLLGERAAAGGEAVLWDELTAWT